MFEEFPDDADSSGDDETSHRGWIAPEDRLWRHPSEFASPSRNASSRAPGGLELWRERRGPIAAGAVGAAAVAAAAVVVLALANAPGTIESSGPVHVTVTSLAVPDGMDRAAYSLRQSLVELQPAGDASRTFTGVVLPGGSLIVTSALAAAGMASVEVTTYSGRKLRARVVASDANSGVAVIRTQGHLSGATFAEAVVSPGELAMAACMCGMPSAASRPQADVAEATVEVVGRPVYSSGGVDLMDAIEAETAIRAIGGVLVDGDGAVIGILNRQESVSSGTMGIFVPADLALRIADELASSPRIEHGWIGVADSDAPDYSGAEIDGVFSGSPAATAGLEPGDVVVAVDGELVFTHADLDAWLYTVPAGHTVDLTVRRHGSVMTVPVVPAA